jgi:hypothetical protein
MAETDSSCYQGDISWLKRPPLLIKLRRGKQVMGEPNVMMK